MPWPASNGHAQKIQLKSGAAGDSRADNHISCRHQSGTCRNRCPRIYNVAWRIGMKNAETGILEPDFSFVRGLIFFGPFAQPFMFH